MALRPARAALRGSTAVSSAAALDSTTIVPRAAHMAPQDAARSTTSGLTMLPPSPRRNGAISGHLSESINIDDPSTLEAARSNGVNLVDQGGLNGAAYSLFENVQAFGHYTGIRMHGTHQSAKNCVCDRNIIGIHLLGSVHTIQHNATEENAVTGLYLYGNGHRVLSHYADSNCHRGTTANWTGMSEADINAITDIPLDEEE